MVIFIDVLFKTCLRAGSHVLRYINVSFIAVGPSPKTFFRGTRFYRKQCAKCTAE